MMPELSDDRGDVARADITASAGAPRFDRWHPHEGAFDQLQRIQDTGDTAGDRGTGERVRVDTAAAAGGTLAAVWLPG
jgi:hypothetical protein